MLGSTYRRGTDYDDCTWQVSQIEATAVMNANEGTTGQIPFEILK